MLVLSILDATASILRGPQLFSALENGKKLGNLIERQNLLNSQQTNRFYLGIARINETDF